MADDFYIEYIPERRTLWLKFQTLFGSRLLMAMTPAQANEFEQTCTAPPASQGAGSFFLGAYVDPYVSEYELREDNNARADLAFEVTW